MLLSAWRQVKPPTVKAIYLQHMTRWRCTPRPWWWITTGTTSTWPWTRRGGGTPVRQSWSTSSSGTRRTYLQYLNISIISTISIQIRQQGVRPRVWAAAILRQPVRRDPVRGHRQQVTLVSDWSPHRNTELSLATHNRSLVPVEKFDAVFFHQRSLDFKDVPEKRSVSSF